MESLLLSNFFSMYTAVAKNIAAYPHIIVNPVIIFFLSLILVCVVVKCLCCYQALNELFFSDYPHGPSDVTFTIFFTSNTFTYSGCILSLLTVQR